MPNPPFSIERLDHVVLRTHDVPSMLAFYAALGCEVVLDRTEQLGLLQLRLGASMLDIVDMAGPLGGDSPGADSGRNMDHFAVRIEPFDGETILAFCEQHNLPARLLEQPLFGADGYGPAVYLEDPEGNRVELKGPPIEINTP